MPRLPPLDASAVKLATPATLIDDPASWLIPVSTSEPIVMVAGLALTVMLPPMLLAALFSTMASPPTCAPRNERFVRSLITVRLPAYVSDSKVMTPDWRISIELLNGSEVVPATRLPAPPRMMLSAVMVRSPRTCRLVPGACETERPVAVSA
jgi:hypothetical protein